MLKNIPIFNLKKCWNQNLRAGAYLLSTCPWCICRCFIIGPTVRWGGKRVEGWVSYNFPRFSTMTGEHVWVGNLYTVSRPVPAGWENPKKVVSLVRASDPQNVQNI